LLFSVSAPLFTFWQLKTQVQCALALLVGLAAAASAFPRRFTRIIQAVIVALAIFSAFFSVSLAFALTTFPARAESGHGVMPVMPVGQVLLGGAAGIALGGCATLGYFRALRQPSVETRYLFALAALLPLLLIVDLLT